MSTNSRVTRNSNGTFAKGTRSPNPHGRPKKAPIDQFSSLAEGLADFASKPIPLMKNGKKVSQSRAEWAADRYFQQVMAGEVSAEGFLRMINEAEAVVNARREEFLQDAIGYKLAMTERKRNLPRGTLWNPADGPDPDMIIIEHGEVSSFDPLFGDQHKRLEQTIDDRKWQNRLHSYDARLTHLERRLNEEADTDVRTLLEEDIERAVYLRDSARWALGLQAVQPLKPKTYYGNSQNASDVDAASYSPANDKGGDNGEDN